MKKSKVKPPKAEKDVFERLVGGDGDEFTIVCHPVKTPAEAGDGDESPDAELVCRVIDVKDRPKL